MATIERRAILLAALGGLGEACVPRKSTASPNAATSGTFPVHPFGARGTGTDAAEAIDRAVSAALAIGGGAVEFSPGTYACAGSIDLPAGVTYRFLAGAELHMAAGAAATFRGPIEASPQARIFGGAGRVAFAPGSQDSVHAGWWGTSNLQAAVDAASPAGIEIRLQATTYDLGAADVGLLVIHPHTRIVGLSESDFSVSPGDPEGPVLSYRGKGTAVQWGAPGYRIKSYIPATRLECVRIDAGPDAQVGLRVTGVIHSLFRRIAIVGIAGQAVAHPGEHVLFSLQSCISCVFSQIHCNGGAGDPPMHLRPVGLSTAFPAPTTASSFEDCHFYWCQTAAILDTTFLYMKNCVFEGCQRAVLVAHQSDVTLASCWWEDCGASGGNGGASLGAAGYVGESIARIDETSTLTVEDLFCNMYQGQTVAFAMGNGGTLRVRGGQVRATNTPIPIASLTDGPEGHLAVKLAAPLFLGGDQFYVRITDARAKPAANGMWRVRGQDDASFILVEPTATDGSPPTNGPPAAGAKASAIPFLFLAKTEGKAMRASFDDLQLQSEGAPWQVLPPTGGAITPAGDLLTWRQIEFRQCRAFRVAFAARSLRPGGRVSCEDALGTPSYVVPANGYLLGFQMTYASAVRAGTLRTVVYQNGHPVLDSGERSATFDVDKSYLTVPLAKGDVVTATVTASRGFEPAGRGCSIVLRVAEGEALG